jgi:CarboxypepD_reg-like domain/TonB-dependent Receptor Plug Domain
MLSSFIKGQNLQQIRINLNTIDIELGQVLQIIEQRTNFTFSYFNNELPLKQKVTLKFQNESLQKVLETLSNEFNLTFTTINNVIVIKKKEENATTNETQIFGTLRGIVRDSVTSEVLPFSNIYIKEIDKGASTDSHGFFLIPSIPAQKKYKVTISFVGYVTKNMVVNVAENKITNISIYLKPTVLEMSSIVVSGTKETKQTNISSKKISLNELGNLPKGVETDVLRSIQLQPGVQSTGDISAHYYVRGGASDENLVLLNEIPIYNPFHALGIFSAIDPDMINSVEFYKGGFDSRYSGRLSSVMNIITKDGNKNNFGATLAASQLTAKALLEGPIPDGSFIITGRKSYSNSILKKFLNEQSVPINFYDASFKVNYSNPKFLPISKFTVSGFVSNDIIDYKNPLKPRFDWLNSNIGFNWFAAAANSPLYTNLTIYYCNFKGNETPNMSNSRYMKNDLDDFTFKADFNYVLNNSNEFYGGFKIKFIKDKLFISNLLGDLKDVGAEGTQFSFYGGFNLLSTGYFKADLGSRLNVISLTEKPGLFLEPRLNVNYSISPLLSIKAAWGIYQQKLVTISDEDEIISLFEPWLVLPSNLKPSTAIHYIGGFDIYLAEKTKIDAEGYYKVMQNLSTVNDFIFFPTDPLLVSASGKSYGAEVTLNHKGSRINMQLSYSHSWTTKIVGGLEYHPRYDSRNAIKFFIEYDLGNDWNISAVWDYNSGLPYTQITGFYDNFSPANIFNPSAFFTAYEPYQLLGSRNAVRLPDYHRLDLNVSKKIRLSFVNLSIDLNLMNIYNRKNFFYFDTNTNERVNMLPFFPSVNIKAEL